MLPAGIVRVGLAVAVAVCWAALFKNSRACVKPIETRKKREIANAMIATISGIRVLPTFCAKVGGSCGRFNGGVGGGTSAVISDVG